jgi:ubiquinone/menaquinone biosynthesis C-methylase UbiE
MKSFKKHDDEHTGKVLYDLLFNKKVKRLGNLDVEQHDDYVVLRTSHNKKGKDDE